MLHNKLAAAGLALLTLVGTQLLSAATLEDVRARDSLRCGVGGALAGLSLQQDGKWSGMDVDLCRAVAAAVLGKADKVSFVPLKNQDRLDALAQDKIDILARNTTWTLNRDTAHGMTFVATSYFDGQGIMLPRDSGHRSVLELDGVSICVQANTTSLDNLKRFFSMNRMRLKALTLADAESQFEAYTAGKCAALSSDQSQLYGLRSRLENPKAHRILPELISKEPLAPAVRKDDAQWADIVRWTLFALIEAEELGINSVNVDQARSQASNPIIQGLLGSQGNTGSAMGLDADWAYRAISQVGNYQEIFDRNLGSLGIKRGLNALWRDGGLLYAPPLR